VRFWLPPDRGAVRAQARAAVLADWMSAWLGTAAEVRVAPSYRDLVLALERGEADLAWAPPAVCARAQASLRTVLTSVRWSETSCRAVFVVRADAGIRSIADLGKKRAVWVDPLSTSGHLTAQLHLRDLGLDPQSLFSSQRFAGSYRDALTAVVEGHADVTSVYEVNRSAGATQRELLEIAGPGASKLGLLEATAAAPFDALVVPSSHTGSADLERRVLALSHKTTPPSILLEVCRADRFVRGSIEDYRRFDRVLDSVLLGL
jgi:phosphonate transport system substrate-binding protein